MQLVYSACAYFAGLALDALVIAALLRFGYRRFPFVFVYVVVDFLTSIIEIRPSLALTRTATQDMKDTWVAIYYWNERILHVLVFLIVISLVYRATENWRPQRVVLVCVVAGTLLMAGISLGVHFNPHVRTGEWMTHWTRDLNFAAAILDLGLWAILISGREKDYRILMIAGGLGIQFTGGAMGQAFRDLSSPTVRLIVVDLMYLTNLACLYIWWQAFRQPTGKRPPK
jgi:hypothetical protein